MLEMMLKALKLGVAGSLAQLIVFSGIQVEALDLGRIAKLRGNIVKLEATSAGM